MWRRSIILPISLAAQLPVGQTGRDAAWRIAPNRKRSGYTRSEAGPSGAPSFRSVIRKKVLFANVLAQLVPHIRLLPSRRRSMPDCTRSPSRSRSTSIFRLQRYGHRAGRIFRLFVPGKLPLSVYRKEHHGVLAALAMSLSTWFRIISISRSAAALLPHPHFQHPRRLDGHRLLARRGVEILFLGPFYAVLLMAEKFFLLPALKKGESSSARLCASCRNARLCAL